MAVSLIAQIGQEPVTLDEVRAQCRIDINDDDELLSSLIVAARQHAESVTRRGLVKAQYLMVGDRFPSPMAGRLTEYWLGQQWGLAGMGGISEFLPTDRTGYGIVLPFPPLVTVDSIQYVDTAGLTQTLAAGAYLVDNVTQPARVLPGFGQAWPSTRQQINAVQVTFTAGYDKVPEAIRRWILIRVASMYENREEVAVLNRGSVAAVPFVDSLLEPWRVITF